MGDKKISVVDFENQAAVMFIGDRLDIVFKSQGQQQTLTLEIFADTQEQVAGQRITPQLWRGAAKSKRRRRLWRRRFSG